MYKIGQVSKLSANVLFTVTRFEKIAQFLKSNPHRLQAKKRPKFSTTNLSLKAQSIHIKPL